MPCLPRTRIKYHTYIHIVHYAAVVRSCGVGVALLSALLLSSFIVHYAAVVRSCGVGVALLSALLLSSLVLVMLLLLLLVVVVVVLWSVLKLLS